jgi:hypothetical protein
MMKTNTSSTESIQWGWLPPLSVVISLGLLLVAASYTSARNEAAWALILFWLGLLLMYVPTALRLASSDASRSERLGLLIILGMSLYLVKVFHDPLAFGLSDEFMHWRTTNDILQTGHLFANNPLLPVSPFYPGLENVTTALIRLGGLSIFEGGTIIIGVARLLIVLAFFLFCEEVSRSPRVAGIAAVLYMANPSFMEIDAQFAYESLALPLVVWVLWVILTLEKPDQPNRLGLRLVAIAGIGAVVATHHAASYLLMAFLIVWALLYVQSRLVWLNKLREWIKQKSKKIFGWYLSFEWRYRLAIWPQAVKKEIDPDGINVNPVGFALIAVVMCVIWLNFIAPKTFNYLSPWLSGAIDELFKLLTGKMQQRELFLSGSGHLAPLWERILGFASVIFILIGLPLGLGQIWQQYRRRMIVLSLAMGAVAYPLSLAFALTLTGAQVAHRIWPFVYIALALVLAIGVAELWLVRPRQAIASLIFAGWASVIFAGGLIAGWSTWERLPGPYLVGADARSIEPQGVAAAYWARTYLGPRNQIVVDRTNRLLMGAYGEQNPLRTGASAVFFAPTFGWDDQTLFRRERIQYVVLDHRLSLELPEKGIYIERAEPGAFNHKTPLDPQIFTKFDGLPGVNRLFDSGEISIYAVEAISNVP